MVAEVNISGWVIKRNHVRLRQYRSNKRISISAFEIIEIIRKIGYLITLMPSLSDTNYYIKLSCYIKYLAFKKHIL